MTTFRVDYSNAANEIVAQYLVAADGLSEVLEHEAAATHNNKNLDEAIAITIEPASEEDISELGTA